MEGILPGYEANRATWFYLSLPLVVAVFFRFSRVWSVRNLDLALLLSLAPGLLIVETWPAYGYSWLFGMSGLLLVRLFFDGRLERRPRLEPNLNLHATAFLGVAAFVFLMSIVVTRQPAEKTVEAVHGSKELLQREADVSKTQEAGPASRLLYSPVVGIANEVAGTQSDGDGWDLAAARVLAIVAHLAVCIGLIYIGRRRFGDWHLGLAMAVLYLLLPCTAYDVGMVNHVLPAALVTWAIAAFRRPMIAGSLLGLACGIIFFPVFLLPLWTAFYDRKGAIRFGTALAVVAGIVLASVAIAAPDPDSFAAQTFGSIEWSVLEFQAGKADGFWTLYDASYRIPVFVAFLVMLVVLTVWPRKKNLEHLIAHSTAIVVGIQFWYPQQGGVYLLWYLPLFILVAMRPRLVHLGPPDLSETTTDRVEQPSHPELVTSGPPAGSPLFR